MLTVKNLLQPAGPWYHVKINEHHYYNFYMIPPAILKQAVRNYHYTKDYLLLKV